MTNFAEELKNNGYIVFTNKGVSMMPLLRQNKDLMIIKALSDDPKKNDVVLFVRPTGEYILHRITKVHGDGTYTIIGDNCYTSETVPRESIIGILTEIKRDGKKILMTDKDYLRYVKTVPFRRAYLTVRAAYYNRVRAPIVKIIKKILRRK